MRKVLKFLGGTVLVLLLVIAVFVAWNWTIVSNLWKAQSASITEVDALQPRQIVKGCAANPLPRFSSDTPLPADAFAQMKAYSDSEGGAGLMVLIDGKVAGEDYREGVDENTRAFSFSMHKSVLALAYGAAIEDGYIGSIDDPIGKYIEEWAGDSRGEIPLRAFLTMSSGLEALGQADWRGMQFNLSEKTSQIALSLKQIQEPFTQFHYKGSDSQLAGIALSRALKANGAGDYHAYLSEKIWCPIGANDALLWPEKEGGEPRYFAYLDASLNDWGRVGLMMMQDGTFADTQVLPAAWIEAVKTPSANNPKYGLQTWLGSPHVAERKYSESSSYGVPQEDPFLAEDVTFFDGFGGQRVYIVPSAKMVIVRSGETSFTFDDGILVNLALSNLEAQPLPEE